MTKVNSQQEGTSPPRRLRPRIAVGGAVLVLLLVAAAAGVLLHGPTGTKAIVTPPASSSPPRVFSNLDVLLPAPLPATAQAIRIPILAYHLIDNAPPSPFQGPKALEMTVSIKSFDREMSALQTRGYRTVSP